ncbi:MAG: MarR family transcriptional regulator [Clostridia bacterium]|nr:MarR family transcriptional regulator [Clostridia bacterium]
MQNTEINELQLVGDLFRQLIEKYNKVENKKHLYKDLKELTLIEINTIIVIGCERMKSMSEIAASLGVTSGTPTVTIDRLILKGFVERIRDEGDRRQVFIKLSGKGMDVYQSVVELKNSITESIFGILDQEERKTLISILSKINNKVDELFPVK